MLRLKKKITRNSDIYYELSDIVIANFKELRYLKRDITVVEYFNARKLIVTYAAEFLSPYLHCGRYVQLRVSFH